MIHRATHRKRFTISDNGYIDDKKLSWGARGILTFLLSKPDNWKVYLNHLKACSVNGEASIRNRMNELISNDYVIRRKIEDKGRFKYEYEIFEVKSDCLKYKENMEENKTRNQARSSSLGNLALVNTETLNTDINTSLNNNTSYCSLKEVSIVESPKGDSTIIKSQSDSGSNSNSNEQEIKKFLENVKNTRKKENLIKRNSLEKEEKNLIKEDSLKEVIENTRKKENLIKRNSLEKEEKNLIKEDSLKEVIENTRKKDNKNLTERGYPKEVIEIFNYCNSFDKPFTKHRKNTKIHKQALSNIYDLILNGETPENLMESRKSYFEFIKSNKNKDTFIDPFYQAWNPSIDKFFKADRNLKKTYFKLGFKNIKGLYEEFLPGKIPEVKFAKLTRDQYPNITNVISDIPIRFNGYSAKDTNLIRKASVKIHMAYEFLDEKQLWEFGMRLSEIDFVKTFKRFVLQDDFYSDKISPALLNSDRLICDGYLKWLEKQGYIKEDTQKPLIKTPVKQNLDKKDYSRYLN